MYLNYSIIQKYSIKFLILKLDVKLSVEYMSFSAHADAKGIMQLIRQCEPKNVVLVHGEGAKMEFLKQQIVKEFSEWKIFCLFEVLY